MKFAKTFCRPNAVVSVIPAALQMVLEYNEHGLLKSCKVGFTPNLDPNYAEPGLIFDPGLILNRIKGIVPNMISATGGTTWVFGILYTDNVPTTEGCVPKSLFQDYINDIMNGGHFEFYAGYVKSLAIQLNGSLIIRNFLTVNKFNLLPQVVVPVNMKEETLASVMDPSSYPFNKPFIAGYFIFEDLNCRYSQENLFQIKVTNDPKLFVDKDGYWKAKVVSENEDVNVFSYSSIIHNNIKKGCILLAEREDIDSALTVSATRMKGGIQMVPVSSPQQVKCPVCGKINMIGTTDAPNQCDDPHCLSHQYADVQKLLKVFNLPELSFDEYKDQVKERNITCLTDVLILPQYKDVEIKSTLAQAINAVVPSAEVPNSDLFERFANKCNNNPDTVCYYLENPLRIETDLDLVDPIVRRFAIWLEDPYNVLTIKTVLDCVKIEERSAKFDGDPIFRGNKFILTGKFKRGDYNEIASILQSYAAEVAPSFEPGEKLPNAVIQGSMYEGISGQVIQKAKLHNIAILDEDDFFTRYEIDQDLANNLL